MSTLNVNCTCSVMFNWGTSLMFYTLNILPQGDIHYFSFGLHIPQFFPTLHTLYFSSVHAWLYIASAIPSSDQHPASVHSPQLPSIPVVTAVSGVFSPTAFIISFLCATEWLESIRFIRTGPSYSINNLMVPADSHIGLHPLSFPHLEKMGEIISMDIDGSMQTTSLTRIPNIQQWKKEWIKSSPNLMGEKGNLRNWGTEFVVT